MSWRTMKFLISNILLLIILAKNGKSSEIKDDQSNMQNSNPLASLDLSSDNQNKETVCFIKKDGHIYDLSSLSAKKFWFYSEISHNDSHLIFLLSICHPIQNISTCNNEDGACFAYANYSTNGHDIDYASRDYDLNKMQYTSGGQVLAKYPEVVQEGSLKYVYESGGLCMKGNKKMRYKTELHLQCPLSLDDESSGPILMSSPKCLFIFVWMTLAACPKTIDKTSDPCVIKFSNSNYPLNLHSLHSKTFYRAEGINSLYEINICGPISNGSCPDNTAVCDVSDAKSPVVLSTSEAINFVWEGDSLVLSYKSALNSLSTNIYLHCDRTALVPRFFFSSKSSNFYNFSVYTINVCNPQASDCVFEDKKLNVYDLRPLHKKDGNWEVIGRKSDNNVLFNLNVCGPINQNSGFKCPPGPVGACQASVSSTGSRNIGYITSDPVANDDQTITLIYTGGDSCREGVLSSSTRISFICNNINYPPTFLRVTDTCEHLFEWHTPAACPVNVAYSNDCQVVDPLFGHNYDLSFLRKNSSDYHVTNGNQNFKINICGPLLSPCGPHHGTTSVCQLEDTEKSGGEMPAELVFNDGTLTMKFSEGDVGCGDDQWATQILFLCSHDEKGFEGLQYIHADESSCVHHFIWHTSHACPPHEETDCTVKDGDILYDLTPLSDPTVNEIFIPYGRVRKYVLNVCRSVIHSKESRCAYDAGACLIDLSHDNRTLSLGKVTTGPFVESGQLKLKYVNGDICNGTHNYSTIIDFECTKEQYPSYPIMYAEEECVTLFKWSSIYACPQNTSAPEESSPYNCTAVNPLTNYVFDMNSLKAERPYELSIRLGVTLLVSVCGNVNDERCPENDAGACVVANDGKSSNAGKSNRALNFRMWSTYLEYEGGEECSNGLKRSTRISFICQEDKTKSGPILISDDDTSCIYFVNWYAEEACERHIRCFAHSWDRTYDLSSLVRVWGNYEVKDPTDSRNTYLINVCRPLNPVIGVNCHPGSSSCLVRKNEEPLGLGHPILNPTVVADDTVHLMYAHGSVCPGEPGFSLSSRIIFICNKSAGAGTPKFLKKAGMCQIQFEWETSLVCPPSEEEGQCHIPFEAAKTNVDLSPLRERGPYNVTYKGSTFHLNLCGATVCDNESAVCVSDKQSFGRSAQAKLRWDHEALLLAFYGGAPCDGDITGARSTRIFFECDPKAGLGAPVADPIMDDLRCMAVFTWKTNLTCLETLYSSPKPPSTSSSTDVTSAPATQKPTTDGHSLPFEPHTDDAVDMSQHTWVSVLIACVVLAGVVGASAYVMGRSSHGRRLYARAKRTLSRKGYATNAENDTLLQGETAYVYRVDEDEQVLRV